MKMSTGQKIALSTFNINNKFFIDVDYGNEDLDIILFSLDENKKISNDNYTILFSNTSSPDGSIRMEKGYLGTRFFIDLDKLPAHISRMMVVASHDNLPLSQVKPVAVTIGEISYDAGSVLGPEKAAMLIEIYKHNNEWKAAAIGQGFASGLVKLIEHLGGNVEDEKPQAPIQDPIPEQPRISISKINLEKSNSISLEKQGKTFGNIILNLNWNQPKKSIFGTGGAIDLDLGCLYQMKDGTKGIIQALGNSFGDYSFEPFIELDGDDRTGNNQKGETIRINGSNFDRFEKIAVFALIYDGAPRWADTGAEISLKAPGQPEVIVSLNNERSSLRLYGMLIIENKNGSMKITNHSKFYKDQKEYADKLGIYLNWIIGRK